MNLNTQHFIDTHCHLDFCRMGDVSDVIKQCVDANVTQFIVPSVDANNWQRVLALSLAHRNIYSALGVHPHFLSENNELDRLTKLATTQRNNIVAIGEIGLDGQIETSQIQQIDVLKYQLGLAKTLALPVICHGHKSLDTLLKYLRLYRLPKGGVIHGFSGSLVQANEFIKLGFLIGIGGVITYERAQKTRRTVAQLPLASLLLETDSPDMPLSGQQGRVNHPKNIPLIAQQLASLHGTTIDNIGRQTSENAKRLFLA